jgi:hypothetical protein
MIRCAGRTLVAAAIFLLPIAAAAADSTSSPQRPVPVTTIGAQSDNSAPHLGGTGLFEKGPAATALGTGLPPVGTPRSVPPNTFPGLSFNPNSTGVIGGGATQPVKSISGNAGK